MQPSDVAKFLLGLRWPTDDSGYVLLNEDNLPPYRILGQLLADRGIAREPTWTKEDCLRALGDLPPCDVPNETTVSEHLLARISADIRYQQGLTQKIREATTGLGPVVGKLVAGLEDTHIQRQQQLMAGGLS
jgi:hypothetical protein